MKYLFPLLLFTFTLQAGPNWSQPWQPYAHLNMAVTLEKNGTQDVLYSHTHSYNAYKNGAVSKLTTTIDSSDNPSHGNANAHYNVETELLELSSDPKLLTNPTLLTIATIQYAIKDLSKNALPPLRVPIKIDFNFRKGPHDVRIEELSLTLKINIAMMLYCKKL